MLNAQGLSIDSPPPPSFDTATKPPRIRPFVLADFTDMGQWLVTRCKERWPRASEKMIWSHLNGCLNDRFCKMLRSDKAVGLVRIMQEPLEPAVVVEEIFLFAQDGGMEEAADLYPEFRRWIEGIRAMEWRLGKFSDVPMSVIKERIGAKRQRTEHFVDFRQ